MDSAQACIEEIRKINRRLEGLDKRLTNFLEFQRLSEDDVILERRKKVDMIKKIENKLDDNHRNCDLLIQEMLVLQKRVIELQKNMENSRPDKKILEKL